MEESTRTGLFIIILVLGWIAIFITHAPIWAIAIFVGINLIIWAIIEQAWLLYRALKELIKLLKERL